MTEMTRTAYCGHLDRDGDKCGSPYEVCWVCGRVIEGECDHISPSGHAEGCTRDSKAADEMRDKYNQDAERS